MGKIHFSVNYEARVKRKFEKFLEQYSKKIDLELKELTIERYWKFKEQFQANFFIETTTTVNQDRVFELMVYANTLSSDFQNLWSFNGPQNAGFLIFECFYNNREENQPLRWAHLQLDG